MSVVLGIHYGISSGQHDVGACLVINGTLKHFIEEERLLRVKTARGKLPIYSIKKILELEKISMRDIDLVVFPGKTYKKNYDTIKSFLNHYFGHAPKLMAIEHHLAHLASAFFHSNFENSVILSIDGVESIFLGSDFLSVNKKENIDWEDIKHIVISLINEFFDEGNQLIIHKNSMSPRKDNYKDIEKKIIHVLETKVKPAVANDGGDIKFLDYKDGIVKVKLQGSCSGCPSATITLKQGVQNLLKHYIPDIKQVEAVAND